MSKRRVKPKTVRRLLLAGIAAFLVVAAGVSVFWVRGWQRNRQIERWRAEGLEQFRAGQYFEALDTLSKPLNRRREDPEALVAWAESRENLPESDGSHLRDAKQAFEDALALDFSLRDAGVHLLRLYIDLDQFVEACDLAPRLRPELASTTPDDIEVLTLEAQALARRDDREAFGRVLDRLLELGAFPIDVLVRRVAEDARGERPGEVADLMARVEKTFPGDPRTRILHLVGMGSGGRNDGAVFTGLCELFHLDERTGQSLEPATFPDAKTALMATGLFDMLTRPEHAYAMIRQGAAAFPEDETLAGLAARRGWQRGEYEDVVTRADAAPIPRKARADVLAFKALSLLDLGRTAEVLPIAAALTEVKGDFAAEAWGKALAALGGGESADPRATLEAVRSAQDAHPFEPVLAYLVGESLARLQRFDEAREEWKRALRSPLSAGWVAPALRAAETLRLEARDSEGIDAAIAATIATNANAQSMMAVVEAETAALQQDMRTRDQAQEFLNRLNELLSARPAETTEVDRRAFDRLELSRIVALSRVGRREDAVTAATTLLRRDPPADTSNLERLAVLSQQESLGLGSAIMEHFGERASPAVVVSAALERSARGDSEGGAALLHARSEAAPAAQRKDWDQAEAQYAELTGQPDAVQRWRTLVERYASDAGVLRMALTAPSLAGDPALIEQIIARFNTLTGATDTNEPAFVQIARARAMLSGKVTRRNHQQAVTLLYKLIASSPRLITARELLIHGLTMNDPTAGITPDPVSAMTQIEAAAEFAARPSVFLLSGAQMMQAARDYQRAGRLLRRVAGDGSAPAEARLQAASMLVAQGDYDAASAPLQAVVAAGGDAPDARALWQLARVYQAQRRDADALALYRRLAESPLSDPDTVVQVAASLASHGDAASAQRVMERVGSMDLPPARIAVARGRYAELSGDRAAAEKRYEEAVAADPKDSGAWQFLVSLSLTAGDAAKAGETLKRAFAVLPDDPQLKILEQRIALTASGSEEVDLATLRAVLARDPSRTRAAAAVAALDQARVAGKLDDPATLKVLSDSYPGVLAMQGYVARRLTSLPGGDPGVPAGIAERAMSAFPTEPEAARLAVEVAATQERWADMLRAAQAWRERDNTRSAEVDVAIADAMTRLGQYQSAAADLRPRVQAALATPGDRVSRLTLQTYAQALLGQNLVAEAHDTLLPVLSDARIRDDVWVPMAALSIPDAVTAEQWLSEAAAVLGPGDLAGRVAIARGYATLAIRFPQRKAASLATAAGTLAGDASGGSAEVLELLGRIQQQAGQNAEAIESFTAALRSEPARSGAVEALCHLLVDAGRGREALPFAQRAYDEGPKDAAAALNLARALLVSESPPTAATLTRAVDLFKAASGLAPGQFGIALEGAAAAEQARDPRSALWFYERALASGSLPGEIAPGVRNNAAFSIYSASPGPEELARARDLARQAVQDAPAAAHYDTLGHVEAALGSRQAAIAAFRKALELDPKSTGSSLGLAAVLVETGAATEAETIMNGLADAELDEAQRAEHARIRQQLQR